MSQVNVVDKISKRLSKKMDNFKMLSGLDNCPNEPFLMSMPGKTPEDIPSDWIGLTNGLAFISTNRPEYFQAFRKNNQYQDFVEKNVIAKKLLDMGQNSEYIGYLTIESIKLLRQLIKTTCIVNIECNVCFQSQKPGHDRLYCHDDNCNIEHYVKCCQCKGTGLTKSWNPVIIKENFPDNDYYFDSRFLLNVLDLIPDNIKKWSGFSVYRKPIFDETLAYHRLRQASRKDKKIVKKDIENKTPNSFCLFLIPANKDFNIIILPLRNYDDIAARYPNSPSFLLSPF